MKCSEDVFTHYKNQFGQDDQKRINALGLFAFSIVMKEHVEWLHHFRKQNGGVGPAASEIEKWFHNKPIEYFDQTARIGGQWYTEYSRELLSEEITEQKTNAVKEAVGGFWGPFWKGTLHGVSGNIFFSIIVIVFAFYTIADFSFIAWAKKLFATTPNG